MDRKKVLYQHGTLAMLVPGLFTGTQTVAELLKHGDTGIGTLTGLNGELIIVDGVCYQANAAGQIRQVDGHELVPFANSHYLQDTLASKIGAVGQDKLWTFLEAQIPSKNLFYGVRLTGTFKKVKTRAVKEQTKPFPTLKQTASQQQEFSRENVDGTVIGYFAPELYGRTAVPGFHLHFLSADHSFGGHILELSSTATKLYLQEFSSLELHLPSENTDFRKKKLSGNLIQEIKDAES
ncbi:acetolactate decarboxylase [Pediococcus siamensis]|uniref:acetolactate decarboxylase n=1 Tax=Pediococcus siamensis TaxID=381829 RepID=UPI0039A19D6C